MEIRHLNFSYGKKQILNNLSLSFEKGKITTLLGANGSGKTTLFKLCTRNLRPQRGLIMLDEENIFHLKRRDFAKKIAIVHQQNRVTGNITVRELVSYGRTPHIKMMQQATKEDDEAIEWSLEVTNLKEIASEPVVSLSGGQRQRVWIAMALAQKSEMIFLDEPTTYLDVRYQVELLELIKSLNQDFGLSIVMVLHDINQALQYSDYLVGLKNGELLFYGKPEEVINEENISSLYQIPLRTTMFEGKPYVVI
ncbi:MAG: ABC transporter ATP-binding protein [Peptostreptococcaceae bacterium]|nr:ABC transporter ATP-binding protein [Peptostreptococcaceae bacterium]